MTVESYKIFAVKPKAATNLVTNPSFEKGTDGWTTGGSNTLARSDDVQRRGAFSCKCTYQDDPNLAVYAITLTDATYAGAIDIYIPSDYDGELLRLFFRDFTGDELIVGNADMTITDDGLVHILAASDFFYIPVSPLLNLPGNMLVTYNLPAAGLNINPISLSMASIAGLLLLGIAYDYFFRRPREVSLPTEPSTAGFEW